jgi:hypothetical protein
MRKRSGGAGPATPREIFDALKQGGYQFETKNDEIALVSLRALLRKNTPTFAKIPNSGSYGLTAWYPHLKKAKANEASAKPEDDDGQEDAETAAAQEEPDDAAVA